MNASNVMGTVKVSPAMSARGCSMVWQLAPGQLVQLDGALGTRLKVTRGKLWVTLERDVRDIVLEPGASFTIDREGLTLVESQGSSKVDVVPAARDRIDASALWSRIARWFENVAKWAASKRRFVPYY
jgi:hypothetical protein